MRNIISLALMLVLLSSCKDRTEKKLGDWHSKKDTITIMKAGEHGYFLKINSSITVLCKYDRGCFINSKKKNIIACFDNERLIDNQGNIYKKN